MQLCALSAPARKFPSLPAFSVASGRGLRQCGTTVFPDHLRPAPLPIPARPLEIAAPEDAFQERGE